MATLSFIIKAVDEASSVLRSVGDEAEKTGGKLQKIGEFAGKGIDQLKIATAAGAAGVLGLGAAALKLGSDFDAAGDYIRIATGATGEQLDSLYESFKNVAKNSPADLQTVGIAIADLNTRMGVSGPLVEQLATQFVDLGRLTGKDVAALIREGSQAFADWGIAAEDAGYYLDSLWDISQTTGISIDALMSQVQQFGPVLRQMGLGFEEGAALLGSFERAGVDTGAAMTGLSKAVALAAKEGKSASETISEIFNSIKNAKSDTEATSIAVEIFGAKAGPKLADAIRSGRMSIDEVMKSLRENRDTIAQAAADTDGWQESLARLKNRALVAISPALDNIVAAMDAFTASLGPVVDRLMPKLEAVFAAVGPIIARVADIITGSVLPALGKIASEVGEKIQPVIEKFGNFFRKHAEELRGPIAAAIGGVLVVAFGALAVAAGSAAVGVIAATAPLIAIVAVVGTLSAALYLLVTKWDDLKSKFPILQELENIAGSVFNGVKNAIENVFIPAVKKVAEVAVSIVNAVRSNWSTITDVMSGPLTAAKAIVEGTFNAIKTIIETQINVAIGIIKTVMAVLKGDWQGAWDGIKDTLKAAWDGIKELVQTGIDTVKGIVRGLADFARDVGPSLISAFVTLFTNIGTSVKDQVANFIDNVKNKIGEIPGFISGLAGSALDAAKSLGSAIKDGLISGIKGALSGINSLEAQLLQAIKDIINSAIDAINNAIPDKITIPTPIKDITIDLPDNPIPKLASGGIIERAGVAIVGERGPELVLLPAGAAVIPPGNVKSSGDVIVNINGPVTIASDTDAVGFGRMVGYSVSTSLRTRGVI